MKFEALTKQEQMELATRISLAGNDFHKSQRMLIENLDMFSDNQILFDLICAVYTNDGYDFPKKVILLAKRLAKQIPAVHRLKGLPDGDPLTVYRGTWTGGPDHSHLLLTEVSWTTDKRVAIWFANKQQQIQLAYAERNGYSIDPSRLAKVWEATIPRNKIIAYLNDRNECEVLQHMSVINPHIIDIDQSEWNAAIQHHADELKKAWDSIGKQEDITQ